MGTIIRIDIEDVAEPTSKNTSDKRRTIGNMKSSTDRKWEKRAWGDMRTLEGGGKRALEEAEVR